jgi:DNA (cytosine-5)-methyltransferase 1
MTLTVGSLFSGIGGLDLGLERAGMQVIWQSEIEPYACKVLKKHWPEVVNYGDIKSIDWDTMQRPNVICAGYPCQPFSLTGNRKGETDERHLWPWVREAISRLRPNYAILENVRGHLSMGGLSVIADLATIGYDAEWRIVSASSVGAPHRRDRLIIVGYPNGKPKTQQKLATKEALQVEPLGNTPWLRAFEWPTNQPNMVGMVDGLSNWVDRRRGLGNAVVPQVAEVIGRLVIEHANA